MTLIYSHKTNLHVLNTIKEDCVQWFVDLNIALFYPDTAEKTTETAIPSSFAEWAIKNPEITTSISKVYDDLKQKSELIARAAEKNKKIPTPQEYQELTTLFNEFFYSLIRLEKDFILENQGVDASTGLRHASLLNQDLQRELNRLERQGKTFAFALLKIDNFSEKPEGEAALILTKISDIIKRNLRSYDDAYYSPDGEFFITMKQTTQAGGTTVMGRIIGQFKTVMTVLRPDDTSSNIRSCVAQPTPGEPIDDLIKKLEFELAMYKSDENSILEHREISELERFLQDKEAG